MLNSIIDNCKTSKLYDIGRIQAYGVLIAVDVASGNIVACSENAGDFYAPGADQLLGRPYTDFHLFDEMAMLMSAADKAYHQFLISRINNQQCHISAHSNGTIVVIEMEPTTRAFEKLSSDRIGFMHDIALIDDPEEASKFLMERIAEVIGFDRVMLYKFLPGWHGLVLAEKLNPGVQGFLNLHFPASDVPENARRLYIRNLQRYIADTADTTSGILIQDITSLDLTYSQLRAVHPVHIEYLENIGARSSFSISILSAGRLWGMIACHHLTQKQLDFSQRFYCEELSRMTSLHISGLIAMSTEKHRFEIELALTKVKSDIEKSADADASLKNNLTHLRTAFNADSIVLKRKHDFFASGALADSPALSKLQTWLETLEKGQLWQTNVCQGEIAQISELQKFCSGVLYVPLGDNDYLALLRNETVVNQQWAGKPPTGDLPASSSLTPRASFETWARDTAGTAVEWAEAETRSAAELSRYLSFNLDRIELEQFAMHDSLTGLINRRRFELDLQHILNVAQAKPIRFAVYMLDLDRFKNVNDTLGHQAGDELLMQAGSRLKGLLREHDTVARLGGDEFAIIQYNISRKNDIKLVADRIIEELGKTFSLQAGKADVGVSIGIAVYPDHAAGSDALMAHADEALYKVKNGGRNAWMLWSA
jgi:two-component system, chemotaxis family, sensor kinase Cph1